MKHLIKRLIAMAVLACATWNVQAQCPDPDTVTNNTVTLITATTARVNGTQATPTANQTIVLRYVRSGFTDTVSATGSGVMRNLTGLSPSTLYKYYYRTLCSDGRTDNQASYYTFTTLTSTVLYVAERPTVFQYLKTDTGGIAFVPSDTLEWRTPTDLAIIKYKSSNSTFYGYYPSCLCWRPLATDSAGIIAQLDLKVDSVTVSGDSLFWWNNHGISHGYVLPALNNVWKLQGNLATDTSADFLGTTDALPVKFKINGLNAGMIGFNSTSLGYGALPPNASSGNSAFGRFSLKINAGGEYNTAIGDESMQGNTSGQYNTSIGSGSLYTNSTGSRNSALGFYSLRNVTTGTNNIGIGYFAGNYSSTASNQFFLNSLDRTNLAGDTTKSLVYGQFNATAASQRFKINGRLEINDGTQSSGYIAVSDANGRSTWTNPTSIVTATHNWQSVMNTGRETTTDLLLTSPYPARNSITWTSDAGANYGQLSYAGNAGNYLWTLPNATGTIALTSQLGAYLPLAGGTMTGNILATDNTYDIGANGATRFRTAYLGTSLFSPLIYGSTSANGDLLIDGTSDATKTTSYVSIQPTSGNVGINQTAPLAALHVGSQNINNSTDAAILISRTLSSGAGNSHAFADATYFGKDAGTAYNSYDARIRLTGATNLDHYAAFQAAPTYASSGTMTNYYGFYSTISVNSGTISNCYGMYLVDPVAGGGAVTNNYGVYIPTMTTGTRNYGYYISSKPDNGSIATSSAIDLFINAGNTIAGGTPANVGINKVSPATTLEVFRAGDNSEIIRASQSSASRSAGLGIDGAGSNYGVGIWNNGTKEFVIENNGGFIAGSYVGAGNNAPSGGGIISGDVGVGLSAPTSKLHTTSFATAYRAITALRTLDATDYTIEVTANTFTVTLPTAVGITGRIYVITNSGSGVTTVGTTSSQTFANVLTTPTTLSLAQYSTVMVQSNGANWLRLTNL